MNNRVRDLPPEVIEVEKALVEILRQEYDKFIDRENTPEVRVELGEKATEILVTIVPPPRIEFSYTLDLGGVADE